MTDMRTQIESTMFKPVPGGYVFREPYRWAFGPAPHYLVNDAQKDQLAAITIPKRPILWQAGLWGTLCLMVAIAGVAVWAYTRHDNPTVTDTIGMAVLTFVQALIVLPIYRWWKLRQLRPLLAGLPVTDMRITKSDIQYSAMNAMTIRQLVLIGAANTMTCSALLISATIFLILGRSVGFVFLASGLVFAALSIVYYRRLMERVEKTAAAG